MLVLTRKYQEKIRIGNNITITVLRTKGKAVRLGIEAPADVPVLRGELSFESQGEPATEEASTVAFEAVTPAKRHVRSSGAMASGNWETDSRPDAAGCATAREPDQKVTLSRVQRSKVPGLSPKFVNGSAPLRAMMDQRINP